MKSSPDLLGNTERSSVTALPLPLSQVVLGSMSHCEDKMAAAKGREQYTLQPAQRVPV